MREIILSGGQVALVDDRDFERVNSRKWYLSVGRYARSDDSDGAYLLMHRFILGLGSKELVDHIDGNGLNNQRINIRPCSHAENMRNRKLHKNNRSGFKGVAPRNGKWRARIQFDGKKIYLGLFDTPERAHTAYVKAAKELHGEFARFV